MNETPEAIADRITDKTNARWMMPRIVDSIRAAIAAERERCAAVAERYGPLIRNAQAAADIASAIRRGPTAEGGE